MPYRGTDGGLFKFFTGLQSFVHSTNKLIIFLVSFNKIFNF
jgi:hypothetical protein